MDCPTATSFPNTRTQSLSHTQQMIRMYHEMENRVRTRRSLWWLSDWTQSVTVCFSESWRYYHSSPKLHHCSWTYFKHSTLPTLFFLSLSISLHYTLPSSLAPSFITGTYLKYPFFLSLYSLCGRDFKISCSLILLTSWYNEGFCMPVKARPALGTEYLFIVEVN